MSIAAMTAIVLILLTLTGVLRHTVEETGIKNTHVIYWLICVICLKAFLLNPTPEIELNFGLVPIIIGPAVFAAAKGTANRVIPLAFVFGIVYMLINFSAQNPETANYLYGSVILTAALIFGRRCDISAFACAAVLAPVFGGLAEFAIEYISIGYGAVQLSTEVCDAQMIGIAAYAAACEICGNIEYAVRRHMGRLNNKSQPDRTEHDTTALFKKTRLCLRLFVCFFCRLLVTERSYRSEHVHTIYREPMG